MSQIVDHDVLRRFVLEVLREVRDYGTSDVTGDWLQETAEGYGLLEKVLVTEPCGEHCHCAEWDDFPQGCLRIAGWLGKGACDE